MTRHAQRIEVGKHRFVVYGLVGDVLAAEFNGHLHGLGEAQQFRAGDVIGFVLVA